MSSEIWAHFWRIEGAHENGGYVLIETIYDYDLGISCTCITIPTTLVSVLFGTISCELNYL